jgi:hypothetical protein
MSELGKARYHLRKAAKKAAAEADKAARELGETLQQGVDAATGHLAVLITALHGVTLDDLCAALKTLRHGMLVEVARWANDEHARIEQDSQPTGKATRGGRTT